LFNELNTTLGLLIDEYEDECIPNFQIDSAITIYAQYTNKLNLNEYKVAEIQNMLRLALTSNTGVFLFF